MTLRGVGVVVAEISDGEEDITSEEGSPGCDEGCCLFVTTEVLVVTAGFDIVIETSLAGDESAVDICVSSSSSSCSWGGCMSRISTLVRRMVCSG